MMDKKIYIDIFAGCGGLFRGYKKIFFAVL